MASPNLSEIVSTTLRRRSKTLANNVSTHTPLAFKMRQRGNFVTVPGGRTIVEPLTYAENSTYKRYSGYETLDISPSDVITAAEYNWKQIAVAVSMSGLEQLQNSGPEQHIDLLESRIQNAEDTFINNFSSDLFSDGTAANQIGGLQSLIADAPTSGVVGGIDRATWSFWQNKVIDMSSEHGGAASASNIQDGFRDAYLQTVRNRDHVDLIVVDDDYFAYYWDSLTQNQRFTNEELAGTGFQNLMFMDAPVVYDNDCPDKHAYFINTKFLKLKTHRDRNFVPLDPDRFAVNQDAMVKLMGWAGNLTLSNASLQCVIKD